MRKIIDCLFIFLLVMTLTVSCYADVAFSAFDRLEGPAGICLIIAVAIIVGVIIVIKKRKK